MLNSPALHAQRRSHEVRRMFGAIAPRYDLLNHLLSLTIDRHWRQVASRRLFRLLPQNSVILDLCTGTGDLALDLAPQAQVVGCDFAHPMLQLCKAKIDKKKLSSRITVVEGDALHLPFASSSFHALTIAFGLRNLESYTGGLQEMVRVLRPGGLLLILEFSRPGLMLFRPIYCFYFNYILPRIGDWISGQRGPYRYLHDSVMNFPDPDELSALLFQSGFVVIGRYALTAGIASLYLAKKKVM
ncbi:MAG: bifunctional demethylmenaquinone methyltransferase/2-methoxy-6-polyprenyl-1,4-benzoquinol methylase UbiE [Acidobacteria bacterium]|nr:bifunctional demethylmenaquinone methyltransferase/2-methoxy-6-polyprenyl-1,4-benzoquinol methylase UbiE [Acidobacteriota bacterium]